VIKENTRSETGIKYFVCLFLIFMSGSPAFYSFGSDVLLVVLFGICLALAAVRKVRIQHSSLLIVGVFTILCVCHIFIFGGIAVNASFGFLIQMVTAMLIVALFADFARVFFNCLFYLALISLIFYFFFIVPERQMLFLPYDVAGEFKKINIVLHTFYYLDSASSGRNAGAFWEPGALAGYLALALFVGLIIKDKTRIAWYKVVTIILALVTTYSTMGYIALFIVIMAYLYQKTRPFGHLSGNIILLIAAFLISSGAFVASKEIPFLADKIVEQVEDAEAGEERSEINRFGNALYDFSFLQVRPIVGWSANIETRGLLDNQALEITRGQGNALTGFAVRFGLIGWIFCFAYFFRGFFVLSGSPVIGAIGFVLMCVMLTTEKYLNYPLIMTLFFLGSQHRALVRKKSKRRRRLTTRGTVPKVPSRAPGGSVYHG